MKLPFKFYVLRCLSEQMTPCSYEDLLPLVDKAYPRGTSGFAENIANAYGSVLRCWGCESGGCV